MPAKAPAIPHQPSSPGTLGTFAGVFTPSALTILGIILFLRLGYVVGHAGLVRALLIIGLANCISILTTFSLSAIATNLKVKGGGDYYLISRTLGLEFGGAIGVVLFLAQSVSIAFYCIGFGEALASLLQIDKAQLIAAGAVAFLFIFAWMGADWATKFQYVVMGLLIASLVSFYIGGVEHWDPALLEANWSWHNPQTAFWMLFALFFPAVTGFTQGVSMSGDLKDPGRSLPRGTFLAVGVSIVVYFSVAVVFAAALPAQTMMSDVGAMKKVARWSFLVDAGVIAATLSSAMASFLGAPRILQSLAGDRIFPFLAAFAKGHGAAHNPRRGVLLSAAIAFVTVSLGQLDLIARIVSMFFLISYGLLNFATYYEARASSPSFRPRFHWYDRRLSLAGFMACLAVMLAIDPRSGLVAIAVLFAVYQYLLRAAAPARWADSQRSYRLQRIREHLLEVAQEPEHPRDWRPIVLAFSDDPHRRRRLLQFATWLEGDSGLTTAVRLLRGEGLKALQQRAQAERELERDVAESGFKAFTRVVLAPSTAGGLAGVLQAFGVGPLKANIVLINWLDHTRNPDNHRRLRRFGRYLRGAYRLGCNIVMLAAQEERWNALAEVPADQRRIDVWWWGDATSRLMLLLAYLVTRDEQWHDGRIRVLAVNYPEDREQHRQALEQVLAEVRIEAEAQIVGPVDSDQMAALSAEATMVFLPFRLKGQFPVTPSGEAVEALSERLPLLSLVLAAEDIDLDAEPEEGAAAELATALDALQQATQKAQAAEQDAAQAAERARRMMNEIETSRADGSDKDLMDKVKAALTAREEALKAARRAAKARAKTEDAAKTAQDLGAKTTN